MREAARYRVYTERCFAVTNGRFSGRTASGYRFVEAEPEFPDPSGNASYYARHAHTTSYMRRLGCKLRKQWEECG
jgi:hypothetical protein